MYSYILSGNMPQGLYTSRKVENDFTPEIQSSKLHASLAWMSFECERLNLPFHKVSNLLNKEKRITTTMRDKYQTNCEVESAIVSFFKTHYNQTYSNTAIEVIPPRDYLFHLPKRTIPPCIQYTIPYPFEESSQRTSRLKWLDAKEQKAQDFKLRLFKARVDGYLYHDGFEYIFEFLECSFSHGICPKCVAAGKNDLKIAPFTNVTHRKRKEETLRRLYYLTAFKYNCFLIYIYRYHKRKHYFSTFTYIS